MGSKKLKAIAVRGTQRLKIARPDEFYKYCHQLRRLIYRPETRPPFGLDQIGVHRLGWGVSSDDKLKEYTIRESVKAASCYGCPIACRPYFKSEKAVRPGISNFCSGLWYMDWDLKKHGEYTENHVIATGTINALSMDIREVNRIIEWLKGCYNTGVLTEDETGIALDDLGNHEFADELCKKIAYREGFGELLAEGVHRTSEALNGIGEEFIDNVNRGFASAYQPRAWPTTALQAAMDSSQRLVLYHPWAARIVRKNPGYTAGDRNEGAGWVTVDEWVSVVKELFDEGVIDHTGDSFYDASKAFLSKWLENYRTATCGCMILCDWVYPIWWSWYSDEPNRRGFSPEGEAKLLSLATGMEISVNEMLKVGERVRNLERAIMVREGRRRKDDTLGEAYFKEPVKFSVPGPDGVFIPQTRKIEREKFEKLKEHYYKERGWNPDTGIPTRQKLEELNLKKVADELWK
jgi:aldehyde:ferredoxin oxidoreductase